MSHCIKAYDLFPSPPSIASLPPCVLLLLPVSQYIASLDLQSLSIFTVYQGLQFLPLDKLVFMKIHQFVNKLESTYKLACTAL